MVLLWDGAASHHRCQEFRNFLAPVNQGEDGQIHSVRFAPYAPEEHPIETGEKLSNYLPPLQQQCWSFPFRKKLLELFIQQR